MHIEQLYTGCLAEAAYYIESKGEAIIIDPLRETAPYIELANKRNAQIKYVLETHFHADFVSGHIDLARQTGATLVFGPNASPGYAAYVAEDNEVFKLGDIEIKVLHTPGHTMESTTYLLIDEQGRNHAIFTGDTLFIGDVGRPDLAVKSDLTKEDLAGHLYDSLRGRILTLDDEVIVYPGHGAGSACGKNMSKETVSTIGEQRQFNYALQEMTKAQFVELVTDGLEAPPAYFPENARINRQGYESIDNVMAKNLRPLNIHEFENAIEKGALVLDTRNQNTFEKGFVKGALNIALDGQYAPWVGALIPIDQKIVLVADYDKEEEAVLRLARVGFENVAGYLEGGIDTWIKAGKEIDKVQSVEATEVPRLMNEDWEVVDVRRSSEANTEHLAGASNISLVDLETEIGQFDPNKKYLIHCAGGYRSMIASSILKQHGIHNIQNVYGGYSAISKVEGVELVGGKCPTTLLNEKLASLNL